ncbi:SURF1 family protein [Tateyamaria sp. ANG-S1]|uniref:SURF1 family protein n=1 Tax=Tateyamaria sp. ANG-S1 TaxID=1577905 RepID=UPI00057F0657|nr:SURF1 family protein [Tateyamaria sp. ANG-S1]KIC51158.1 cytochrome oxidase biogenesis protein Surf1, facilitates heme A insertion [Tateyamaria sp. ANG-S1]
MRRLLFLLTFGLMGAGILISLGVWQVQRLGWKQDLLARIEAQIDAEPMAVADAVEPQFQRYAPVQVSGIFGADHIRMLASRRNTGAVYRIVRPFEAEGFGPVLIDTGWLPDGEDLISAPEQRLTIVGNLDAPNEADNFTPAPDLNQNLWFARDVPAMAETLETQPILIVLRDAPEIDLGVTPWPVDTAGIPNDHLQYAITWFSLAAIWVLMTAYFVLRTNRSPR